MDYRITRVLTFEEKAAMEEEAIANGWYRNDRRMFTPGMAWHTPWVYAPPGHPYRMLGKYMMYQEPPADPTLRRYLSVHYWKDWADKRPPIEVVCPNGVTWQIDRKSSNGDGWKVTGELPNITCHPSIDLPGYHGWLKAGIFAQDQAKRGPDGYGVYPY